MNGSRHLLDSEEPPSVFAAESSEDLPTWCGIFLTACDSVGRRRVNWRKAILSAVRHAQRQWLRDSKRRGEKDSRRLPDPVFSGINACLCVVAAMLLMKCVESSMPPAILLLCGAVISLGHLTAALGQAMAARRRRHQSGPGQPVAPDRRLSRWPPNVRMSPDRPSPLHAYRCLRRR